MLPPATPSSFTFATTIAPILVALVFIAACALLKEPSRQKFSAIFVAGAGAAYLGAGFGVAELIFCMAIVPLAYRGLTDYRAIGLAWLLHSGWDLAHDLWGNPILPFAPDSSLGCFVCDPVIAIWYLLGAPSIWQRARRSGTGA